MIGGAQGEAGGTGEGVPTNRIARIGPKWEVPDLRMPIDGVTNENERRAAVIQRPEVAPTLVIRVILSASAVNGAVPCFHKHWP